MEFLEKLKGLSENLLLLEAIKEELSSGPIPKRMEWEIRYGLFESIQIVIDIACKVTAHYNLGHPKSYGECIAALAKSRYIDEMIASKATKMIGLRNLLIHEYTAIDPQKLIDFLNHLDDFREFASQIEKSLSE